MARRGARDWGVRLQLRIDIVVLARSGVSLVDGPVEPRDSHREISLDFGPAAQLRLRHAPHPRQVGAFWCANYGPPSVTPKVQPFACSSAAEFVILPRLPTSTE